MFKILNNCNFEITPRYSGVDVQDAEHVTRTKEVETIFIPMINDNLKLLFVQWNSKSEIEK